MNTNERATLRRWISDGWHWHRVAMSNYSHATYGNESEHHLHQGQRWARFAAACERRLKEIEDRARGIAWCGALGPIPRIKIDITLACKSCAMSASGSKCASFAPSDALWCEKYVERK